MRAKSVGRSELHAMVWTKPMPEVADDLGVTRTELDVLCAKLDVPYPFSGYWNGPAGAQGRVPRLRSAKPGTPDAVEVAVATPEPQPVRRTPLVPKPNSHDVEPIEAAEMPPPVLAEASAAPSVPTRLTNPHRIIAARLEEERRRSASWNSLGVRSNTRESQIERRRRIIENLLYKALEKSGHKVETERGSLYGVRFIVNGQTITYAIRERYTQKRRPLSPEELKEPYNVQYGRTHTQERLMTGELILAADARYAAKTEWKDKPDHPLELQIGDMVQGIEALAGRAAEAEARRAEQERAWREEQALREEQRRLAQQEANRWRRVRELAARHEEARRVWAFLAELKRELTHDAEDSEGVGEWLAWVERRAAAWDPVRRGLPSVIGEIQAVTASDYSNDRTC